MISGAGRYPGHELWRRLGWRVAIRRCGLDPRATKLVSLSMRPDGNAIRYTVESRTREAWSFFEREGHQRLGWALGGRAIALGSDPYRPNIHQLLIETAPLEVGVLPLRESQPWQGEALRVPIGCDDATGEPLELELFTPGRGTTSVLIAGTTGGGKSNTLRVMLEGLLDSADVLGLDAKSGETLSRVEHRLALPFVDPVTNVDGAIQLLQHLLTLMVSRHEQPSQLHRPTFLIIEEWAALPERTDLLDLLDRLAAQGRSAHIGVIAVTQRPTATKSIRTTTRANLPIRIAHSTVGDQAASEAILGGGIYGAADIPTSPPGQALLRTGGGVPQAVRIYKYL